LVFVAEVGLCPSELCLSRFSLAAAAEDASDEPCGEK
jgi:hypothetical protein